MAPDLPEAERLLELLGAWSNATTRKRRARIWADMLAIHADQLFTIGLIAGTLQPVVANLRLRNVPETGLYNWDPGAHFGIYEPDTFWLDLPEQVTQGRRP
jgi:peptide/nickel transport system substrate-binding protein